MNSDQAHILNFNPLSSGIMTTAFDGSLYTSMHCLESIDMLVVGTGNGSLRQLSLPDVRFAFPTDAAKKMFLCSLVS